MINAKDISQYQGNWVDTGEPIVIIKMSGGDAGLYYDSKATQNYYGAKNSGKAVGMYHFAGGTDPIHEADFFIKACSPLEENDVLVLDWEISNPDPVSWCLQFVNHVRDATGIWPLIYMNTSTFTAHDWSPVVNNCGLWIADYRFTPDQDVPTGHPYIMHQYTSIPYDRDAWFGTIEQFKAYGYHSSNPVPEPTTTTTTLPPPVTTSTVTTTTATTTTLPPTPTIPKPSLLARLLARLTKLIERISHAKRSH